MSCQVSNAVSFPCPVHPDVLVKLVGRCLQADDELPGLIFRVAADNLSVVILLILESPSYFLSVEKGQVVNQFTFPGLMMSCEGMLLGSLRNVFEKSTLFFPNSSTQSQIRPRNHGDNG